MKQVYFLCTGNSCRSQIAEGYARQYLGADWQIQSAGVETHGLNPLAVQVMQEDGIDISHHTSKLIDNDYLRSSDLVVTLCGDARDKCPMTPPSVQKQHWPLADPAQAQGTPTEKLAVFRQVRDEIKRRVQSLS
ncbi:arsenate reductase [Lentilactobacillus senioris DSM 24302 = JCM 17472]|uniref:Arsenate reductase n=1 Tax=Lentilactobacillus senioris DSM 24302 = JCM 17472 TaxID=1423802 RepID=A0A0R2D2D4_9LACO|nr:arsenate reductase (thioredoxin) [Lentilactobacillus senioris]KRM94406.1 arsenate reductase [Lentilactobacillus senioris DSM 24302 = JCM 17472]